MHGFVDLFLNGALLWIVLQTTFDFLASVCYHFTVPWLIWGTLISAFGLRLARIPPPDPCTVQEVLGINPLSLAKGMGKDHGTGEQICMRVVAHRGGGYDCPENSLTAIRNSKQRGCRAVEIDLMLTKDNVPIVFHDSTIERLTGQVGKIKDMTWNQLKDLDITHNHPLKDKFVEGEKIALFFDVLEECLNNAQRIFIDVKESNPIVVQKILEAYKKYPKLYQRGIVCSFNPIVIYMIRLREPKIVSGLTWRPQYFSRQSYFGLECPAPPRSKNIFKHYAYCLSENIYECAFSHFMYYIVGASAVLLHKDIINQRVIEKWNNRNIRVLAWTVNLPSEKVFVSRLLKVTYMTDTLLGENDM